MSAIQDIINQRAGRTDRGVMPSDYQMHIDRLKSFDIIADNLDRIAKALEDRNIHDGIIIKPLD
jgi:hypothetical protein